MKIQLSQKVKDKLSNKLISLRTRYGYTQEQVAKGIKVFLRTYKKIENIEIIHGKYWVAISRFYDIPLADFFEYLAQN